MTKAVVFAYHNVGVRCLSVLIAQGVDIALVVTHEDNPQETIWFGSVSALCKDHGIPFVTPASPANDTLHAQIADISPDFIFSFYYRHMIPGPMLALARRGAFNMHGSLLPKYRGRVPVNWAIIHGETESGATLHVMNEKPDNGALVDQFAVPILPDDTASMVFDKVTVAAELVLHRTLPALIAGTARLTAQDLSLGGYFGGRKPEDGRIHGDMTATQLHNFVRALTLPFPGAFVDTAAGRIVIWKTLHATSPTAGNAPVRFIVDGDQLLLQGCDGQHVRILSATLDGAPLNGALFKQHFGNVLDVASASTLSQ